MEAEWLEVLPRLRQQVGERNYATWIEPIHCVRDARGLCLEVESRFFQEWVAKHFLASIQQVMRECRGAAPEVRVVVAARNGSAPMPGNGCAALPAPSRRNPQLGRLVPAYTFENFVVGPSNEIACNAARTVAATPARQFNPLFVWGGVGLGKTHLVNALAHDLLGRGGRRRVAALSAEGFMNSLISALRQDQMPGFRDRFRALDVLILDDVQFLAGKERTQEEFSHTFEALHAAGKQVVLTSDKPPQEISHLERRLRSRFEGGLIADIHPPTPEMRIAILRRKAAAHGVDLPADVAQCLAEQSGPTVRELEGVLTRVLAFTALRSVPLSAETVGAAAGAVARPARYVSTDTVLEVVSDHFQVPVDVLVGHARTRSVAFPRHVAMYLSRLLADASFAAVAERFGGRDHSSVLYAMRVVEGRAGAEPQLRQLLDQLRARIRARASR
jgi:chromosomal replication initiator protein